MGIKLKFNSFVFVMCGFVLLSATGLALWFWVLSTQIAPVLSVLQLRKNFTTLVHQVDLALKRPDWSDFEALQSAKTHYDHVAVDSSFNQLDEKLKQSFDSALALILSQQTMLVSLPKIHKNMAAEILSVTERLKSFSDKLSENGAYSIETIREVDRIITKLPMILTHVAYLSDMNQTDGAFTVAALSNALQDIEFAFNRLQHGDPSEGIQSLKGGIDEAIIFETQSVYGNIALVVTELLLAAPELIEIKQNSTHLAELVLEISNQIDLKIQSQFVQEIESRKNVVLSSVLLVFILLIILILLFAFYAALKHKTAALEYVAYSEQEKDKKFVCQTTPSEQAEIS